MYCEHLFPRHFGKLGGFQGGVDIFLQAVDPDQPQQAGVVADGLLDLPPVRPPCVIPGRGAFLPAPGARRAIPAVAGPIFARPFLCTRQPVGRGDRAVGTQQAELLETLKPLRRLPAWRFQGFLSES